jgi:hypothetical protein
VLSCIVLRGSCEECLREEESGEPESWWASFTEPLANEVNTVVDVLDP